MSQTSEKFDLWALVELFGHTKIAGRCTEQNIAGTNMLRVDVPETKSQPAFTRFFGSSAIYAINPMDEQSTRIIVEKLQQAPINSYDVSAVMKKHQELLLEGSARAGDPKEDYPKGPHEDDDHEMTGDLPY
jgi:hypothetical protein